MQIYHNRFIHTGVNKLTAQLRHRFYWTGMHDEIYDYVSNCVTCAHMKYTKHKAEFKRTRPTRPGQCVACDFIGPLGTTKDGNNYILTMTDLNTGYSHLAATKHATAADFCIAFQDNWIHNEGIPEEVLLDNGPHFRSKVAAFVAKYYRWNIRFISPYNKQANGFIERLNRIIRMKLAIIGYIKRLQDKHIIVQWDRYLKQISMVHNCTINEGTGFTSYKLQKCLPTPDLVGLGNNLQLALQDISKASHPEFHRWTFNQYRIYRNIHQLSRENLKKYYRKKKNNVKLRISKSTRRYMKKFRIGDTVYRRVTGKVGNSAKNDIKYDGPWTIEDINPNRVTFFIKHNTLNKTRQVHCRQVKLYHGSNIHNNQSHVMFSKELWHPRYYRPKIKFKSPYEFRN